VDQSQKIVARFVGGEILIAMSDGDFIAFAAILQPGEKVLIGIRSDRWYPLTRPNVARHVIAPELGHALGLRHHGDQTTLRCGRPAPCRPDAFQSEAHKVFPLIAEEQTFLLTRYPSTWQPAH
jgi:hypothetical protein